MNRAAIDHCRDLDDSGFADSDWASSRSAPVQESNHGMDIDFSAEEFFFAPSPAYGCASLVPGLLRNIRRRDQSGARQSAALLALELQKSYHVIYRAQMLINQFGRVDETFTVGRKSYSNAHDSAITPAKSMITSLWWALDIENCPLPHADPNSNGFDVETLIPDPDDREFKHEEWDQIQKYCAKPEFFYEPSDICSQLQRECAAVQGKLLALIELPGEGETTGGREKGVELKDVAMIMEEDAKEAETVRKRWYDDQVMEKVVIVGHVRGDKRKQLVEVNSMIEYLSCWYGPLNNNETDKIGKKTQIAVTDNSVEQCGLVGDLKI